MLEKNSLSIYQSRNENIIRHPLEAYAEVSVRSIHKIRNAAEGANTQGAKGKEITLAVWTACVGAVLGYIPDVIAMYKAKSLNNSVVIYLGIIIIGIIFFFIWREKMQKESTSVAMLANLIQEEFRFLYKGIIIKHNKTEPTYTKTSLFLCEKRRFFMARTEKGVVATI